MTFSAESVSVQGLLDKSAITEVICTVAHAMDTRDWDLFATCYAPEAEGDYVNANVVGREAIIAGRMAVARQAFLRRPRTVTVIDAADCVSGKAGRQAGGHRMVNRR